MRDTRAGSCATILCSELADALGSSTVAMILFVTSGSVASAVIFFTASATYCFGSVATAVATAAAIFAPLPAQEPVVLSECSASDLRGLEETKLSAVSYQRSAWRRRGVFLADR